MKIRFKMIIIKFKQNIYQKICRQSYSKEVIVGLSDLIVLFILTYFD